MKPLPIPENEPWRADFFDAMRRIEAAFPNSPRLGASARPEDEPVRLGQPAVRAATTNAIASVESGRRTADGAPLPPKLLVNFLGLFGPNGALPLEYTEYAIRRGRHEKDAVFTDFADVFHHRMLLLFYRAWAEAEPVVGLDRGDDKFGAWVGSLIGLPPAAPRDRRDKPQDETQDKQQDMQEAAKLFFAGRLAQQARNADGLEAIVSILTGLPAEVEELVGEWLDIPQSLLTRLGGGEAGGALGCGATLGPRVYEARHRFRMRLGPMDMTSYKALLPGEPGLARLLAIIRDYVGDELAWDIQLVLLRSKVPEPLLGKGAELGWNLWLTKPREPEDPDAPDEAVDPDCPGDPDDLILDSVHAGRVRLDSIPLGPVPDGVTA